VLPQWDSLAIAFGLISMPPSTPLRIFKNLRVCSDCHTPTKFIGKVVGRTITTRDAICIHYFANGLCSCRGYRWCPASLVLFSVEGCVLKYYTEAIYREKMNDNHGVSRKRGCILEKRRVQGCHAEAWHDLFSNVECSTNLWGSRCICRFFIYDSIEIVPMIWNDLLVWSVFCFGLEDVATMCPPAECRITLLPTLVLCTWMHILEGPSSQPFSTCAASKNEVQSIHQQWFQRQSKS
jgi:hypothetical protein